MEQIDRAIHEPGPEGGSENNANTGRVACSGTSLLIQDSVVSTPRDPFTDSNVVSTITEVSVNDLDQVGMSVYQNDDTGG
jgi:hypothetical protein